MNSIKEELKKFPSDPENIRANDKQKELIAAKKNEMSDAHKLYTDHPLAWLQTKKIRTLEQTDKVQTGWKSANLVDKKDARLLELNQRFV